MRTIVIRGYNRLVKRFGVKALDMAVFLTIVGVGIVGFSEIIRHYLAFVVKLSLL